MLLMTYNLVVWQLKQKQTKKTEEIYWRGAIVQSTRHGITNLLLDSPNKMHCYQPVHVLYLI